MTETPPIEERLRHNAGWRSLDGHCLSSPGLLTEAADEIASLRARVEAMEVELAAVDHAISEVAKLSNPDWTEIRVYPLDTLDTIHAETTHVIGDVMRRAARCRKP